MTIDVERIKAAAVEADDRYERLTAPHGCDHDWALECFLPTLKKHGLLITDAAKYAELETKFERLRIAVVTLKLIRRS